MQEEKEIAKSLKEEMAKKKENEEAKTTYSKDELVEMLKNARISRRYSVKGSAPKGNGNPHHKLSDNGESSSDNDDSDLSSTSSEEEKSESDVVSSG